MTKERQLIRTNVSGVTSVTDVCPRDAIDRDVPLFEGEDKEGLQRTGCRTQD